MTRTLRRICVISSVFLASLGACSGSSNPGCDDSALRKLHDTRLEVLRVVTKKEPYPESSPYAGLRAYFDRGELRGFDRSYPGEQGLIEMRFWVLSETSYVVEVRESWYAIPIDPKADHLEIAERVGNTFFVCSGRLVRVDSLRGWEPFEYVDDAMARIGRSFGETLKEIESLVAVEDNGK